MNGLIFGLMVEQIMHRWHHRGLLEVVMGIYHSFLLFYIPKNSSNNQENNEQINQWKLSLAVAQKVTASPFAPRCKMLTTNKNDWEMYVSNRIYKKKPLKKRNIPKIIAYARNQSILYIKVCVCVCVCRAANWTVWRCALSKLCRSSLEWDI